MKILFDTNVVLDLLLDRQPFSADATHLFAAVESGKINGCLCATTLTTIHYLAAKTVGAAQATQAVSTLLALFEIAPVTRAVLDDAVGAGFSDYEDAVLYQAARHAGADGIVTRNQKDFAKAELPLYMPIELVSILV